MVSTIERFYCIQDNQPIFARKIISSIGNKRLSRAQQLRILVKEEHSSWFWEKNHVKGCVEKCGSVITKWNNENEHHKRELLTCSFEQLSTRSFLISKTYFDFSWKVPLLLYVIWISLFAWPLHNMYCICHKKDIVQNEDNEKFYF